MTGNEAYLGDGVYVKFDGYQIEMWVSDGLRSSTTIFLDQQVFANLMAYGYRCYAPPQTANDP